LVDLSVLVVKPHSTLSLGYDTGSHRGRESVLLATVVTINNYVITISTRDMYVALAVVILELTTATYFFLRHRRRKHSRATTIDTPLPAMVSLPRLDDHR
jgi:hypothetical protein